jgi:HSP20 family protein
MNAITKPEARPTAPATVEARSYQAPAVDIFETHDGYLLKADMPGVHKEGLEVLLEGTELTIVGRTNRATPKGDVLYRESTARDFRRVFALDPEIDAAKISAQLDQGVLTLSLPKAEKVKPRRISITG